MNLATLAAVVIAASPTLKVRVLEHAKLREVELRGTQLTCDDKPLASPVKLSLDTNDIVAGDKRCAAVTAQDAALKFGDETRRYRGLITFRVAEGLFTIFNDVDLESYLKGVVASEATGPKAFLEAQAIVSRTYALAQRGRHRANGYDLCDLTHCQLYRGAGEERDDASKAVASTAGQVLLVGNVILSTAYFHSSCGGATSSQHDVFGDRGPDEQAKDGELDAKSPDFKWEWTLERAQLAAAMHVKDDGAAFEPLGRDASGRVLELKSFGQRFTGVDYLSRIGQLFGYQALRSMKVSAQEENGLVHFEGRGLGHGVGLCQTGASALAEKGSDARSILKHYFPSRVIAPAPAALEAQNPAP